jgi:hypothetical protein
MISCHEATRLISESRERWLWPLERLRLWLHTRACALCARYGQQVRLLHWLCAHADMYEHEPDRDAHALGEDAKERIRDRLRKQAP